MPRINDNNPPVHPANPPELPQQDASSPDIFEKPSSKLGRIGGVAVAAGVIAYTGVTAGIGLIPAAVLAGAALFAGTKVDSKLSKEPPLRQASRLIHNHKSEDLKKVLETHGKSFSEDQWKTLTMEAFDTSKVEVLDTLLGSPHLKENARENMLSFLNSKYGSATEAQKGSIEKHGQKFIQGTAGILHANTAQRILRAARERSFTAAKQSAEEGQARLKAEPTILRPAKQHRPERS